MRKRTKGGRALELASLLGIRPGVTAVIGSGGKTSLLRALGRELAASGRRTVLCTTTKIYPFPDAETLLCPSAEALVAALKRRALVCAGEPVPGTGKLTAPGLPMKLLAELADYVLVEADGSARRPLKAHAPWEPVIPPEASRVICVTGVGGFGLPIREAAHRPERFAALAGCAPADAATPENTARVLAAENLAELYLWNQTDTPERWEWARRAADALGRPSAAGSIQKGVLHPC